MTTNNSAIPIWGLAALSWLVSFYFLLGFVVKMGFPPSSSMTATEATYLFMWLFFLFLPFFKKIKIGKFLELERDIYQTKKDVKQLREQVQNNFSLMASSIATISNLTNTVTVNLPGALAVQEAKQDLQLGGSPASTSDIEDIKNELTLDDEDTIMALARTRIRIEYMLRSILGKRTEVRNLDERPVKLMGLLQLFRELVASYPNLKHLDSSISYVNKICSAAIHAQQLPLGYADEALDMGARIIAVLRNLQSKNGSEE